MARRTQISFSTFNLYNLNRPNKRMYRNTNGWSDEDYEKKIEWSSRTILESDSRIWGFQELWDNRALSDVFEKAKLTDKYDLIVPINHSGNSIICAGAVEKGLLSSEPLWIENFHPKFILQSCNRKITMYENWQITM